MIRLILEEVLTGADGYPPDWWLYLPAEATWDLNTDCVLHPDGDVDGLPKFASQEGLLCSLEVADIQDVSENARQQLVLQLYLLR